jgi:hypothetical protein
MSSVVISGDTSGAITLAAPAVSGTNTATLPAASGTVMVSGNQPTFSAAMSTTQTISNATFTKINFDTKNWDTNTNYNASTYRFTPTVAGYYQVTCSIDAGASTAAVRVISNIYKNGSLYRIGVNLNTAAAASFSAICTSLVYMNGSTDYIECYGYVGATIAIVSPSQGTWFDAVLVRAA